MDIGTYKEINNELAKNLQQYKILVRDHRNEIIMLREELSDEHRRRVEMEHKFVGAIKTFLNLLGPVMPNIDLFERLGVTTPPEDVSNIRTQSNLKESARRNSRTSQIFKAADGTRSVSPTASRKRSSLESCDSEHLDSDSPVPGVSKSQNSDSLGSEEANGRTLVEAPNDEHTEGESVESVASAQTSPLYNITEEKAEDKSSSSKNDIQEKTSTCSPLAIASPKFVTKSRGKAKRYQPPTKEYAVAAYASPPNIQVTDVSLPTEPTSVDVIDSIRSSLGQLSIGALEQAPSSTPISISKNNTKQSNAELIETKKLFTTEEDTLTMYNSDAENASTSRPRRHCVPTSLAEPSLKMKLRTAERKTKKTKKKEKR